MGSRTIGKSDPHSKIVMWIKTQWVAEVEKEVVVCKKHTRLAIQCKAGLMHFVWDVDRSIGRYPRLIDRCSPQGDAEALNGKG
jgi:hypothetical protein